MSKLTYKWRKGVHRWTATLLSDGSGIAIEEWRGEFEYREWAPSPAKPTAWMRDETYVEFAGISKNTSNEITRTLAKEFLAAWKAARVNRYKDGWVKL